MAAHPPPEALRRKTSHRLCKQELDEIERRVGTYRRARSIAPSPDPPRSRAASPAEDVPRSPDPPMSGAPDRFDGGRTACGTRRKKRAG